MTNYCGYLYYSFDSNIFSCGDLKLKELINQIDKNARIQF